MKDYTLSQILAHCKKMNTQAAGCESCRDQDPDLYDFCQKEFECFPIRWGERYIIEEQGAEMLFLVPQTANTVSHS